LASRLLKDGDMTTTSSRAICITLALLVAAPAVAEEAPVVVIEPGTYQVPPPATQPYFVPRLEHPSELERKGRSKKLAGTLLMSLGAGVLLGGAGLFGWGLDNCRGFESERTCIDNPAMVGGAAAVLVGLGAFIAGIPVYAVGVRQIHKAKRLSAQLTLGGVNVQY
jgi:hypothetical protein